jgi:hypothetical protein
LENIQKGDSSSEEDYTEKAIADEVPGDVIVSVTPAWISIVNERVI